MLATALSALALAVVPPPEGAPFSYQIGGAFTPEAAGAIVARDRTEPPGPGHYSVCYVNAFQAQPGRLRWWRRAHPRLLLRKAGREVVDRDWNEVLLDVSTGSKRAALASVVGRWIDGCATSGYQAVEPDNLDSWTRSKGRLDRRDALAFSRLLVARAHAAGLAIAQKNAAEVTADARRIGFDFAIAEECQVYRECHVYRRHHGRAVIEIEYTRRAFRAACARRAGEISVILRDRDVTPIGAPGAVEQQCPPGG